MAVYYPSFVVNLRLRFDESFQVVDIPVPVLQTGETDDTDDPTAVAQPTLRPLITQKGKDNLSQIMNRVPKSATVECPSVRQAGSFSLEFDWRELPIDPRLFRSIGVEIYAGTVSPDDFATGMTSVDANGQRRSIMKTVDAAGKPRDDLMLLAGVVDSVYSTHGDTSIIRMEGRDLRGIFIDSPCDPKMLNKLDLKRPVTYIISDILRTHPSAGSIVIRYHPNDWEGGHPPSPGDSKGLTRVRRGAGGDGAQAGMASDAPTYWDVITQYCFLVGAIPFFRGRQLIVRKATSIYDQSKPDFQPSDRPFSLPRVDESGRPFAIRKFVYGRNVKEISFERKLSGTKVPMVEVVSIDTSNAQRGKNKMLIEQWPPKSEKAALIAGVAPSGEVAETDKVRISVPGIRDRERLIAIAKQVYEEVGRGELGGSCQTTHISSFGGSNEDPDVLRLRPSDAVEFLVDSRQLGSRAPAVAPIIDDARRSFEEQVQHVRSALSGKVDSGDENLARVIVASSRSMVVDLLRYFRVGNAVFNWTASSGISVNFDFQNYFVARYGINDQTGPNTTEAEEVVVKSRKRRYARPDAHPRLKAKPKKNLRIVERNGKKIILIE